MAMRFGVLGAAGQLGSDLCPRLPGEVVELSRAEIDLTRHETISEALAALRLDVLVNCAAYNFVNRAEEEPDTAFAVNAWGVKALARACRREAVRLVHFSTDYVFGLDTNRTTPYTESDVPGPVNVYGLSKLVGEYLVRAECPNALVIRTCGLYGSRGRGGKGTNFVETMLKLAREEKSVRVVNDQRCTPTFTSDLAEAAAFLIDRGASGLFHVTSGGSCTWYEFAKEIFDRSGLKPSLNSISTTEADFSLRRPGYSVLSNTKSASAGLPPLRSWQKALAAYLLERKS